MSGMFTNGMPLASASSITFPLTGTEQFPADTQLTAGSGPETVALTTGMVGLAGNPVQLTYAATTSLAVTPAAGFNSRRMAITLTGNVTFTAPTSKSDFRLVITQDGTGNRTGTFPASMLFVGGSKTLSTAAGAIDMVDATYAPTLSGTTWTDRWLCTLNKAYS